MYERQDFENGSSKKIENKIIMIVNKSLKKYKAPIVIMYIVLQRIYR